jgi:transposase
VPRQSKLTPQLIDQLVAIVEKGNYNEVAAQAVGISKATLYRWLQDADAAQAVLDDPQEAARIGVIAGDPEPLSDPLADSDARKAYAIAHRAWTTRQLKRDLRDRLTRAQATAEDRIVTKLTDLALSGNERALMFWLERKGPERWGRSDKLRLENEITVKTKPLSRDERLAKLRDRGFLPAEADSER